MHKVKAKNSLNNRKAEELASSGSENPNKSANNKGKNKKEESIGIDPLMPVVTEAEFNASGSDPSGLIEEFNKDGKVSHNPKEKKYAAEEAKRSIHYPYATGPQMATFFDRMRLTKRSFYFQEQGAQEVKLVEPDFCDNNEDAVEKARRDKPGLVEKGLLDEEEVIVTNNKQRDQWYGLCRMEYMSRQQQYRKKSANSIATLKFIIPTIIGFLICLCVFWPMWDNLLDIETNNHYATLGLTSSATTSEVKKAYRSMTKQWHPDHNPDCGQTCRDMMMKIQEAYDKLSVRGQDAEEAEQQRENQLKEALHQIRNLIFFKAYSIAFYCAEYINLLVLSLPFISRSSRKSKIETMVRILVVVAFSAAEVIFVTGFNLIIILQIFYFAVNMVTGSASKKQMEKWMKRSNFDFRKDFCFFVLPALGVHLAYFLFLEKYPKTDVFIFDCALGFAYVASHLAKFTPNLFDNWALKKCSLTTQYMKPVLTKSGRMGLQYTAWNFWTSEFSIILDDLFAYTSSIPSVFRLVVIGIHMCYLVQLRLLPWDAPVTGKLGHRFRKQKEASAGSSKKNAIAASPLDDSDDDEEIVGDFAERLRNQSGNVPLWRNKKKHSLKGIRALSDTEREWFTNVDSTGVLWMDIPYTKYGGALKRHSTPNVANTNTQLCMTPNLQELLVVHVNKNKNIPASIKDPALLEAANQQNYAPVFKVVERHYDPDMCRLLYRDMKATIFLNIAPNQPIIASEAIPDINEKPIDIVYRVCGGQYGLEAASNNDVRRVSLLTCNVSIPGIRAKEAVVSFALQPEARTNGDFPDADPKGRRPWIVITTLLFINLAIAFGSLAAVYGLYMMPEPEMSLRNPNGGANRQARGSAAAATSFEPFLTPVSSQKYTGLLPGDHLLNTFAAGAIVIPPITAFDQKLPIPVFVPDLWDSLRQMSLFSSGGGGAGFGEEQQQQQGEQKQGKRKARG